MSSAQTLIDIANAAAAAERATGCPAELLAAQCALESGWLVHAPGNNCFGIKAYPGCFGTQLLATTEWFTDDEAARFLAVPGRVAIPRANAIPRHDGRSIYDCRDFFATFATLADCFTFRGNLFSKGRYAAAAAAYEQDRDFPALVRAIAPIYATAPNYADQVLLIARKPNVQAALAMARQSNAARQPGDVPGDVPSNVPGNVPTAGA